MKPLVQFDVHLSDNLFSYCFFSLRSEFKRQATRRTICINIYTYTRTHAYTHTYIYTYMSIHVQSMKKNKEEGLFIDSPVVKVDLL